MAEPVNWWMITVHYQELLSKNLQQATDRKKSLQEKLLKERKLTHQAKAQLETLKGLLKEHEEREKCQEAVLNKMNATADRVRDALNQKLKREKELREQLDAKVSEIEGVSRDILFKFQNLKLRDSSQDEEDVSKINEDIISLEREISKLQQEKISFLQKMDDRLKVDELKLILSELDVSVLAVTEERNALERTVAKLEEELQQLKSEKTALAEEGSAVAEGNVCSGE
ncbi:putative leucine-rich repeat-containing protein DDB_G0290503 [Macrobrachium nipponense]|uniref:putative leucine-rich repeat-containing protein DDB_G0290503 n=1 Tax=Macrobrachium nipponense TaxID=159736 RepID=UPI0030C8A81D